MLKLQSETQRERETGESEYSETHSMCVSEFKLAGESEQLMQRGTDV